MRTYVILYHPGYRNEKRVYALIQEAHTPEGAVREIMGYCPGITPLAVGPLGGELKAVEKIDPVFPYRVTNTPFAL